MPAGGTKPGGKGASGHATNAALQSDEDLMARRAANFKDWKHKKLNKVRKEFLSYANSPTPPKRTIQ